MPSFQKMFFESKGKPIEYRGRVIQLSDEIVVANGKQVKITFESVNSEWRQGIFISTEGFLYVNEQAIRKAVVLWQDTAPSEVVLTVKSTTGRCRIKNVWDAGDGVTDSGHNGAAMIVEKDTSGKRYRCNDGKPDEGFDDLVFRVDLVESKDQKHL